MYVQYKYYSEISILVYAMILASREIFTNQDCSLSRCSLNRSFNIRTCSSLLLDAGNSLVRGDVEEEVGVLRRRVLRTVRPRIAHDEEEGPLRFGLLGPAEEGQGRVGDQVGEVVRRVVVTVADLQIREGEKRINFDNIFFV